MLTLLQGWKQLPSNTRQPWGAWERMRGKEDGKAACICHCRSNPPVLRHQSRRCDEPCPPAASSGPGCDTGAISPSRSWTCRCQGWTPGCRFPRQLPSHCGRAERHVRTANGKQSLDEDTWKLESTHQRINAPSCDWNMCRDVGGKSRIKTFHKSC